MTRELGELEDAVMSIVWDTGAPMKVRETMNVLRTRGRVLAYTTVATVMVNLQAKGWLHRISQGRAFAYAAVCTRAEYAADLLKQGLECSDDATASFVALLSDTSQEQRRALEAALRITGDSNEEVNGFLGAGGMEQ
ncbi:BlaI/MecI/CopY family transcriptional regulator [Streptomyces sp.]|uniref:BlaI/MecI/CopY family transcriptional regulator n=1 Tax=Streptomyces sp. TaxID=1931 RepID=UPI002D778E7D|nr:BlaI/MecI/CopY family transcriptional regulator [Streptomyces sp.]HET6353961.1 BlaI/MecI/CopY family transcriptional regulator [Streptomyces sp.]